MTDPKMFTGLDAALLADAFPQALRADAIEAAEEVLSRLRNKQRTERFEVHLDGDRFIFPRA